MTAFAKGKSDLEKVFQDGYVEQFLSQTVAQNITRLDAMPPSINAVIDELQLIEAILLVVHKKYLT